MTGDARGKKCSSGRCDLFSWRARANALDSGAILFPGQRAAPRLIPKSGARPRPSTTFRKSNVPFLIIHGTRDEMVPIAQAQALYDKLKKAGATVQFVHLDSDHVFHEPAARRH
jgi:predicted esterase